MLIDHKVKYTLMLFVLLSFQQGFSQPNCSKPSLIPKECATLIKDISSFVYACPNCIKLEKFNNKTCDKITDYGKKPPPYVTSEPYGIFGAKDTNKEILDKLSECPLPNMSCPSGTIKKNPATVVIECLPVEHESSINCAQLKGFTYSKSFTKSGALENCQSDSASWVENIIRNKNKEGKDLAKSCPDECSFYTSLNISNQKQDGSKCSLNSTVHVICGPPKTKSKWISRGKILACEDK